ncbi:MAG TPA: ATP-binding protein [Solirubrobacteraceae bacterium]|nr:ATP-binding protein [Solirubrobacteraceae bacterium]
MAEAPNLRLDLVNSAENVVLVRAALTGLAEAIGLHEGDLADIQTAATEACNNVVQHAYPEGPGPLEVELRLAPGKLDLLVRDEGRGMHPGADGADGAHAGGREPGIGVPVIRALSHRSEFRERDGGGTEVWSEFATAGISCAEPLARREGQPASERVTPESVALVLDPVEVAEGVLPRVLCVLAARAHFSTEGLAEVRRFALELVSQSARAGEGEPLGLCASVKPRALELAMGARRLVLSDPRDGGSPVAY